MAGEFAPNEGNLNPVSVLPLIMSPVFAIIVNSYPIEAARAGTLIDSASAANSVHLVRIMRTANRLVEPDDLCLPRQCRPFLTIGRAGTVWRDRTDPHRRPGSLKGPTLGCQIEVHRASIDMPVGPTYWMLHHNRSAFEIGETDATRGAALTSGQCGRRRFWCTWCQRFS